MKPGLVVAICGMLCVGSTAAESALDLQFDPPAQLQGVQVWHGAGAIVIAWHDDDWNATVDWTSSPHIQDHVRLEISAETQDAGPFDWQGDGPPSDPPREGPGGAYAVSPSTPGFLVVHAGQIEAHFSGTNALDLAGPGVCAAGESDQWIRPGAGCITADVVLLRGATLTRFDASHVTELEWYGVVVDCENTRDCPDGGGTTETTSGPYASTTERRSQELRGDGSITWQGAVDWSWTFGEEADIHMDGAARLPRAAASSCSGCTLEGDGTLRIRGDMMLHDVRPADRRLAARAEGDAIAAAIDETSIDPAVLWPRVAAATGALAVLAWLARAAFGALVHRAMSAEQVLENPSRQRIHALVLERPGASMRELARSTGLASGTVRHHLAVLTRYGVVAQRRHHQALRYFENHGKHDHDWQHVSALRSGGGERIVTWVADHPDATQAEVVRVATASWGWKRATAEYRVRRLENEGVLEARRDGRCKRYRVVTPERAKPAGLGYT